jgi:hypothetical protein
MQPQYVQVHGPTWEKSMTKFLTVLAAGSAVALVSVAAPTAADARCWGCGAAAGVIGGIAAGAIIAGAASNSYYGPGYGYAPGYAYAPSYAYAPGYGYGEPAYYGGYRGHGYGWYGPATSDYTHTDRDLVGTR